MVQARILVKQSICLAVLIFTLVLADPLAAQDRTWDNGGNGTSWSDDANWSGDDEPNTVGENAIINSGGSFDVTLDMTRTIGSLTIGNDDSLTFNNNVDLNLNLDSVNHGEIIIAGVGATTDLNLGASLSFSGTGELLLQGGANTNTNRIRSNVAANDFTLTNAAGHTIRATGNGRLGDNTINFANAGLLVADGDAGAVDGAGATLLLDAKGGGTFTNTSTFRAVNGGTLELIDAGGGGGLFDNTGGVIEALDSSTVQLGLNAVIVGGELTTAGSGEVLINNGNATLRDLTNSGNIRQTNNNDLFIGGTITNNSQIVMAGSTTTTDINLTESTTFNGSGELLLQGGANTTINRIRSNVAANDFTLTNTAGHTIRATGNGRLGDNTINFNNAGLVVVDGDAGAVDGAGATLLLDAKNGGTFTNTSTFRATNGGTLELIDAGSGGGGLFNNTGGIIEATGAGSEVQLGLAASVTGGTVRGTNGGLVRVEMGQNAFFHDVTFEGAIQSDVISDFNVSGTITNNGNITLVSSGNFTEVVLQDDTTLEGDGTIELTGPFARITGAGPHTLTNNGNTITGRGNIGNNQLNLVQGPAGKMIAGDQDFPLFISPRDTFDNAGTVRANPGQAVQILNFGAGGLRHSGLIEAIGTTDPEDDDVTVIALVAETENGEHIDGTGGTYRAVNDRVSIDFLASHRGGTFIAENGGIIASLDDAFDARGTYLGATPAPGSGVYDLTEGHFVVDGSSEIRLTALPAFEVSCSSMPPFACNVTGTAFAFRKIGPNASITINGQDANFEFRGSRFVSGVGNVFSASTNPVGAPIIEGTVKLTNGTIRAGGLNEVTGIGIGISETGVQVSGQLILEDNGTEYLAFHGFTQTAGLVLVGTGSTLRASGNTFLTGTINDDTVDLHFQGGRVMGGGSIVAFDSSGTNHPDENQQILFSGATIAPGDSVGTLSMHGDVFLVNDTTYEWEIGAASGIAGTDWDLIDITGPLDFDYNDIGGSFASGVVLELSTLPEFADSFDTLQSYSWVIASADSITNFNANDFSFDLTGFLNPNSEQFSVSVVGNDLVLNYTGGPAVAPVTDIDNDGDVDGTDFLFLQRNAPSLIPQWVSEYGTGSGPLSASQAVPEPATVLLMALSLVVAASTVRRHT